MTSSLDHKGHVPADALADIAAGGRCAGETALHLAGCTQCRRELTRRDPSALFGLLPALPAAHPAPLYPVLALPERPAVRARAVRWALVAAAGVAVFAVLVTAELRPRPPAALSAQSQAPASTAQFTVQVNAPAAQVMTLVPSQSGERPVTLILGLELDL